HWRLQRRSADRRRDVSEATRGGQGRWREVLLARRGHHRHGARTNGDAVRAREEGRVQRDVSRDPRSSLLVSVARFSRALRADRVRTACEVVRSLLVARAAVHQNTEDRMLRTVNGIFVFCFLLAPPAPLFAQTFGQITGIVADTTGGVLVGASVTVTNTQTAATVTQQANTAGVYVFPNLLPGMYNVKVEMDGFRGAVRNVELQIQQTIRLDFRLEIGPLNETVEAVATAPMLNTEDAAIGTVIENRRIVELPLNGRNFLKMVELTPNVSASFSVSGSSGPRQGGDRSAQQLSIGGGRREWYYFTLDGINNTDVNFNSYIFLPSIDALQEFKVQTGIYSAEFGRELGQVSVTTKAGTNVYHGTVFEFLRNNKLDALPYAFAGSVPTSSPSNWNQFGFTLGGPVQIRKLFDGKDKLFFMGNYEGFRL